MGPSLSPTFIMKNLNRVSRLAMAGRLTSLSWTSAKPSAKSALLALQCPTNGHSSSKRPVEEGASAALPKFAHDAQARLGAISAAPSAAVSVGQVEPMDQQIATTEERVDHRERSVSARSQQEFEWSVRLDGQVNLVLRFVTDSGPRTIIAPGVPRKVASDIAKEMEKAGHRAEYTDHLRCLSLEQLLGGFLSSHR